MTTADITSRQRKKAAEGPRPKHVPLRTCVACRRKDSKRQYVRIVRSPDQTVQVDRTGKANGRGAYLCARRGCWEDALASGALGRALKTTFDDETRTMLAEYSRSHFPPDDV